MKAERVTRQSSELGSHETSGLLKHAGMNPGLWS
jgi:hypothetical protein